MKYNHVEVVRPGVRLIELDTGKIRPLSAGLSIDLEKVEHKGREYHVIGGSRIGAITSFWTSCEASGAIRLGRMADDNDPTWDGIPLPIKSSSQLLPGQMHRTIAHFVKGRLLCNHCTMDMSLVYPNAIAVTPANIIPYSQDCHGCGQLLFDIARTPKGPNILYKKYVKPEKKR